MSPRPRVILGVGGTLGHDANTALLVDGRLVAASEQERFSRKKHDSAFPEAAILDCLATAGCGRNDVDACVFADKPFQSEVSRLLGKPSNWLTWQLGKAVGEKNFGYLVDARKLLPRAEFHYAWHHLAHASLAFATSPYERAAFLCVDGQGDDVNATIGIADSRHTEISHELAYGGGIGTLYAKVTDFLGFSSFGSEYKVMGLAPFGNPTYLGKLRSFAWSDCNGALRLHPNPGAPGISTLDLLSRHLGLPARQKGGALGDEYVDLAASMQALFEEQISRMADFAKRVTGERFLLFCGGCAQNCVAAGKLRDSGQFDGVFTSPAASDAGTGLGAAILYRQRIGPPGDGKIDTAGFHLGCVPGDPPAEALDFKVPHAGDIFEAAAQLLAQGKVLGWVRGKMELGARALGARSILADARVANMQSMLNGKVKFRESFRPFAPAILAEECGEWFDSSEQSDFMQYTAHLKPEHRRAVPPGLREWRERLAFPRCEFSSVVHVDYSARLQTVRRDLHPDFHRLITEFRKLTGFPMIINTSMNVSGEPIVRTAREAWDCFRHTEMDYLAIDDILLRNPNDTTYEEKLAWRRRFEEYS